MGRYISLLLFIGMMFGQDVLKTVSGKEYKGKYLKTEGGKVFFIPEGANSPLQVVPVKLIQTLKLKDGHFIIGDGKSILTFEEYQKVNNLIISNKGNKGLFLFCSIITVVFIVIILSEFHSGFSMSGFDLSGHETAW